MKVTAGDMVKCFSEVKPQVSVILNIEGESKSPWADIKFLSINDTGSNAGKIIIHGKFKKHK